MPREVWLRAVVGGLVIAGLAGAGCGSGDDTAAPTLAEGVRTGPLTPTDPERLPDGAAAAIAALAEVASPDAPAGGHHGHSQVGPQDVVALEPADQPVFDEQWAAAVDAVPGFDTIAEAEAAGYVRAAAQGAGVGVHYVQWSLIDRPFDPARTRDAAVRRARRTPPG